MNLLYRYKPKVRKVEYNNSTKVYSYCIADVARLYYTSSPLLGQTQRGTLQP